MSQTDLEPLPDSGSDAPGSLAERIQGIRDLVLQMGDEVDRAIVRCTRGLTARDVDLCAAVVRDDAQVNAMLVTARELSIPVLARASAPADLREAMGLLHTASELERIATTAPTSRASAATWPTFRRSVTTSTSPGCPRCAASSCATSSAR